MKLEIDPEDVRFEGDGQGSGQGNGILTFVYSRDRRVNVFCQWLVGDLQNDPPWITEVADAIGRRMAGETTEVFEFSGNAFAVVVAADGVEAVCHYSDDDRARLPLADAAVVLYRFWAATRTAWRPARFDKAAKKFANRNRIEPLLPWELDGWAVPPTRESPQQT